MTFVMPNIKILQLNMAFDFDYTITIIRSDSRPLFFSGFCHGEDKLLMKGQNIASNPNFEIEIMWNNTIYQWCSNNKFLRKIVTTPEDIILPQYTNVDSITGYQYTLQGDFIGFDCDLDKFKECVNKLL